MLSFKEYKRTLGEIADTMSDDDILKLQKEHYQIVEIALDILIDKMIAKNCKTSNNEHEPH